jgi:predicted DNA-binding transcriptional regulator AlpA
MEKQSKVETPSSTAVSPSEPSLKLISRETLLEKIGVTYPTVWAWVRDKHFPAARVLGKDNGGKGRIAWVESEVDEWINSRPRQQPKNNSKQTRSA